MGLKEDLEAAKSARVQPKVVDIVVNDTLYGVEVKRLDGMEWAAIMAECPPDAQSVRLGYDAQKAALVASCRHGRLLDAGGEQILTLGVDEEGTPVPVDWDAIFAAISGVEVQAIAGLWWGMNVGDPNQRVVALKKASAGGSATS